MTGQSGALSRWTFDPLLAPVLLATGVLYARGAWVLMTRKDLVHGLKPWQAASFAVGWLTAVLAVISPLDRLGLEHLTLHMAQYALLTLVAAPLVVLGRPLIPLLWAFPPDARKALVAESRTRTVARAWRLVTHPLFLFLAQAGVLWLWHVPGVAQAVMKNEGLRALQHGMVFTCALLFFQALVYGRAARMGYGVAAGLAVAAAVNAGALAALLTSAAHPWYTMKAMDPLLDQHVAGLVLAIASALVFGGVAVALIAAGRAMSRRRPPRSNVERLAPRPRPTTRIGPSRF